MTDTPDIIPRDIRFGIAARPDRAWFDGDLLKSALVDGFAVMLPEGERFFIRSLKPFVHDLKDAEVLKGIQGYALQEAFHTREHESYNDGLRALGYDVDGMEATTKRMLSAAQGPRSRVVVTCAIEQITYSMSRSLLGRPKLLKGVNPDYRRLWTWHALEEVEHAAVAFQVLHAIPSRLPLWKRYVGRIVTFGTVVGAVCTLAVRNAFSMIRASGQEVTLGVRLRFLWIILVYPGFISRLIGACLLSLRPGYRGGGGAKDARLIESGRRLLAEEGLAPAAAQAPAPVPA
ncbi:metal-dependent hydrolase [Pararoseomonas indoligenes]|uniref:Metal-dependent hydrolase n=1 Tax=Roseomonas indoligenes TaxID=2820811 RepID=A0A940N143_9PROT|nr:metal-dependent hydrolase [Pararoseomonas indoligenes]MBP0492352.1 metal-dependent hydrolase [Pararoseomonas indoligenes]